MIREELRSELDIMAEDTDTCVCCGRPRSYPVCPECQDEDARAFAEDMMNGNPWEDDLPMPKCRAA